MSRLKKENKNLKDKYTFIGSLKLISNLRSTDFWALMDELVDEGSGFYNNRCWLLDAWKEGNMHSLAIGEPGDMLKSPKQQDDALFCKNCSTKYLLPCLIVTGRGTNSTTVEIIWTHNRVRRMGLGTAMIKKLGIKEVHDPLPGSEPFWKAVNLYQEPSVRRCEQCFATFGFKLEQCPRCDKMTKNE
jgi:hypothetical protein